MEQWTQLGISGLTLAILFFIVRWFVKTIDHNNEVIANHIEHEIRAKEQLTRTLNKIDETLSKQPQKILEMAQAVYRPEDQKLMTEAAKKILKRDHRSSIQ